MEFIREKIKEKPISKRRIAMRVGIAALCGLTFALVACIVLIIAMPFIMSQQNTESVGTESESEKIESTQDTEDQNVAIVLPPDLNLSISDYENLQQELYQIGSEANKSVVTVIGTENKDDWTANDFETEGSGSGIIVSEDNNYLYVLTERRIIEEAPYIHVTFVDGTGADATLFKYDGKTGISILTVEKRLLKLQTKRAITVAKFADINTVKNGSLVMALGSPLGDNHGIVTGNITSFENEVVEKDRNYSVYTTNMVASQTGSGVLINIKGEVVGIIMQRFSGASDVSALTAVSIGEISGIIQSLRSGKDLPYVGVYLSTVTDEISETYNIPKGVYITEVVTDSPAMKAGLQNGDVITHINGDSILTDMLFSEKIAQLIPGTTCEISVKRQNGNQYYEVKCTVTIGVHE